MAQAAVSDGQFLDLVPRLEDGLAAAEVDVGGGQVAEAFVVATVVVVVDEGGDGGLELARQEVVLEQDAVLRSGASARSCPGSADGSARWSSR